jgi:hypothetical protein
MLVVAAVGAPIDVQILQHRLDLGGVLSVVGFVGALWVTLPVAGRKPDEAWYRARAGAESVKTLAWRYAVGGNPFLRTLDDADIDFTQRLQAIIDSLRDLDWPQADPADQITIPMRNLRAAPIDTRMQAYIAGRVDVQRNWYTTKAGVNRRRARQWGIATTVTSAAGVLLGVARALTWIGFDWLVILAAAGAAASAWTEMRQHSTLASSYAIAAQELGLVKARSARITNETEWSQLVSDAVDAISREHTLWLACRGRYGGGNR